MNRIIYTLCAILLQGIFVTGAHAQSLQDALRYSLTPYSSTARSLGAGGSMSSLGADFSVANVNPAGIAEFRKSEFAISFGLPTVKTQSTLGDATEEETGSAFKMNNLAVVFAYNPDNVKMKTFNLAFGINKLADFNEDFFYAGASNGTRVERFLELSNQRTLAELDAFEAGLAYDTQLILDGDNNTVYESDFSDLDASLYRQEFVERSGSMNELFLTMAGNYNNKFSYGLTLGIPIVNYRENRDYLEEDDLGIVPNFFDFIYSEQTRTSGGGINLKAGLIYKPIRQVRLSAAIHSPTWLFLTDEFSTSLDFRLDGEETGALASSPLGTFDYQLRTPWRALAGIGVLYDLGDIKGFINGEVEYVDYSSSSFSVTNANSSPDEQFFEDDLNSEINNELSSALNFRLGTELAYQKFRVRVGAAILGDPYNVSEQLSFDPQYNLGLGYRGNKWYVDLAYSISDYSSVYSPYRLSNPEFEQSITNSSSLTRFSLTVGTKI